MINQDEQNTGDQWLVARVLGGDSKAFSTIVKNTEPLVASIVFKMIADKEDRKDIAQDIYMKAFKNLVSFRFQSKLSTWIARIAYNTCLNHLSAKKAVMVELEENRFDADEEVIHDSGDHFFPDSPEKLFIRKDLEAVLKTEIGKLSPVHRTMITLYHNEELSYSEIAEITSLPEGTVKSHLFRARKALRESLLNNYKREAL